MISERCYAVDVYLEGMGKVASCHAVEEMVFEESGQSLLGATGPALQAHHVKTGKGISLGEGCIRCLIVYK